jgi:hypothetical protein
MITINEDLFKLRISKWHVSFQGNYSEQRKLVEIGESILWDKGKDGAPKTILQLFTIIYFTLLFYRVIINVNFFPY